MFNSQETSVDGSTSEFRVVGQHQSPLDEPYVRTLLEKWGLRDNMLFVTFSYTKYYHKLHGAELVRDLFNDSNFQQHFKVATKKGLSHLQGTVGSLEVQQVPATETRLDMFDRLAGADPPILRTTSGGDIIKCSEDHRDGFQVSDELRRFLLCEDSEHADLYSTEEKQQLLWRLFELLCLGGACCQFEDQVQPYLEVTKRLYKALLSVQKDTSTGKLEVASTVFEVKSCCCESGVALFPSVCRNNMCFVAIDPLKRIVRVLYHGFIPYW